VTEGRRIQPGTPRLETHTVRLTNELTSRFFIAENNNRNTFRRSGDWCDWSPHATILFVRQHGQLDESHRNYGRTRPNQCVRGRLQVSLGQMLNSQIAEQSIQELQSSSYFVA
jgi:hypothetical protein